MTREEKERIQQKLHRAADAHLNAYGGNLYYEGVARGLEQAAGIVGKVRCEEVQHWTPCNERLPKDDEIVMVTACFYGNPLVFSAYLEGGEWIGEEATHWSRESILAWMPLPNPYREEEKNNGRSD